MNYYSYELLRLGFEEIDPLDFYRTIFPDGELAEHVEKSEKDNYEVGKYSAIAICVTDKRKADGHYKVERYTITDEFDNLDKILYSDDFCFMSPISYAGKSRMSKNARFMYALCVEIDNLVVKKKRCFKPKEDKYNIRYNKEQDIYEEYEFVGLKNLINMFGDKVPRPTYIVSSGTGIHLYYVFKQAIPMFPNIVKEVEKYKKELTRRLWNKKVTYSYRAEDIQFESIFQGFRIPGTLTKAGLKTHNRRDDVATAHEVGDRVDITYMNSFVQDIFQMNVIYKSKLTKAKAKELYPEWFERRIVNGEKKGHWVCSENVYKWWYNKIYNESVVGHRYYCIMMLCIYAVKCDIPYEKLESDCFSLLNEFEKKTIDENNHFTEKDILDALLAYKNKDFVTYPINSIINRSGIYIEKNKRNGRKQKEHMQYMRGIGKLKYEMGESSLGGRPSKKEIIELWQQSNPGGTKYRCQKDTGLSKNTVSKWWVEKNIDENEEYNDIITF